MSGCHGRRNGRLERGWSVPEEVNEVGLDDRVEPAAYEQVRQLGHAIGRKVSQVRDQRCAVEVARQGALGRLFSCPYVDQTAYAASSILGTRTGLSFRAHSPIVEPQYKPPGGNREVPVCRWGPGALDGDIAMTHTPWWPLRAVACACLLICGRPVLAQVTNEVVDDRPPSLETLQRQLADEQAHLLELKRSIQQQEARLNDMRRTLGMG
ncbi:hypothetical protein VW29_20260, partial [Devosia limi DSM 17137]